MVSLPRVYVPSSHPAQGTKQTVGLVLRGRLLCYICPIDTNHNYPYIPRRQGIAIFAEGISRPREVRKNSRAAPQDPGPHVPRWLIVTRSSHVTERDNVPNR